MKILKMSEFFYAELLLEPKKCEPERTSFLRLHKWCPIQSNGHDEVPPITLIGVATSSLGDKIRIKVRATVDQIQVK